MELSGVLAAILSAAFGGTAVAATRLLAGAIDPIALGAIRFAGGFLILLPIALVGDRRWPPRQDWPASIGLGVLFFAVFPVLFNASLIYTTAARGALALASAPLMTMLAAALLGIEPLTARKTIGVAIAMAGVAIALATGLSEAPPGAWRGDLLMAAAAFCMALYNVWSRPFIDRSGPIPFTALGMGVGAASLLVLSLAHGGLGAAARLDAAQWLACAYLAVVCGALIFFLWAYALGRTTPTLVAVSVTVNPVTASIVGLVLLGEPIGGNLVLGLAAVLLGIAVATGVAPLPIRREQ